MGEAAKPDVQEFVDRWQSSGAAERANYQLFLSELCDIIEVEHPKPTTENPQENAYVFEKNVPSAHGTSNFIDLYKRDCFVLEAKQGSEKQESSEGLFSEASLIRKSQRKLGTAVRGTKSWDTAMEKARQQAQTYARSLPSYEIKDGRPPFILVVDVGNTIEFFSEFSRTGGNYIPFPDPSSYRLGMDDLHDANVRKLLRQVWDDPMSLDPSRRSAKVTREIASRLAELAKSLEGDADPEIVAQFLMRCLFTMFAEDVRLLPERSFTQLLNDIRNDPKTFKPMLEHLWGTMDKGGFSVILRQQIPKFNGGLFADQTALELTLPQIELLVEAAKADWRDVEPAIFGTLLERALNPVERHKLGAHYTPRAYVERLVKPTIIEPLREEWKSVQAAALLQSESGRQDKAIAEVEEFHRRLASIRILDPACGSGNFLYVTLEHLKRLEGEVLNTIQDLGEGQMKLEMSGITVSPQQFFGLEVNPRAAAIAELVLWIGYLQWHYRTRGDAPLAEPIIKDFHNIECRDALMEWDDIEPLMDDNGESVTIWDGRTTKPHPVTGEAVPDERVRIPSYKYINPRKTNWPDVEFVVGNPPFIGIARTREALGDGYTESLRSSYKDLPESIDYVMYWWDKAAELSQKGKLQRFGFITTNSLRQTFNRRVLEKYLTSEIPISLIYAIPDHPWVDTYKGASVRIAMTVAQQGEHIGLLKDVLLEKPSDRDDSDIIFTDKKGKILSNLRIGANISIAKPLISNQGISNRGFELGSAGFIVTQDQAKNIGLGKNDDLYKYIRPYLNGRDLAQKPRNLMVIDLHGLSEEDVRDKFPEVYQWIYERVKPKRNQNRDKRLRKFWWLHRRSRQELRDMLIGLNRYISTIETSKHRFFTFFDQSVVPDNKLVNIALTDAFYLGVLSSSIHIVWALATGSRLGVGNDPVYVKGLCFESFPFPDPSKEQQILIRELADKLDNHRKQQQTKYPKLTLTNMYNVLEKVRAEEFLNDQEQTIHEQGLVSILKQLHEELDNAVFDAYGWETTLSDEEILQRLVDLNIERTVEEANGYVRWLRPDYQAPDEVEIKLSPVIDAGSSTDIQPVPIEQQDWPTSLKERATAIRNILATFEGPVGLESVAEGFKGRKTQKRLKDISEILEMLLALGQIEMNAGRYTMG